MCGRYTLTVTLTDIESRFACPPSGLDWNPRYNIAPTQQTLVVVRSDEINQLKAMKWGLVPHWAKDPKMGSRLINARLETIDKNPPLKASCKAVVASSRPTATMNGGKKAGVKSPTGLF
jgi:Uncharacterized conserved protein